MRSPRLSPWHVSLCHFTKFVMPVARLISGMVFISFSTGERKSSNDLTKGCNYLFCVGLIGPRHSIWKQSDATVIIEGIQWEVTIYECDDWRQTLPGGNYGSVFRLQLYFFSCRLKVNASHALTMEMFHKAIKNDLLLFLLGCLLAIPWGISNNQKKKTTTEPIRQSE